MIMSENSSVLNSVNISCNYIWPNVQFKEQLLKILSCNIRLQVLQKDVESVTKKLKRDLYDRQDTNKLKNRAVSFFEELPFFYISKRYK